MAAKKILVIDNEEYIQEVTKICLESTTKWQVITASSGVEGIKKAETQKPDVILLDVMMPGMDGITVFKTLQENSDTKEIPVIILTATIQTSDNYRYKDLGIKAAIGKPFSPLTLAQEISQILAWDNE